MGQVLFAPALAGCTSDDVTASAAQVLSGYTALTKDSNDDPISGTMTNRGAWTSSSSGSGRITVPAGYHNGSGYVDCSGAYNAGVTAADARTNTSSANYKAGYNSGYSAGRSQGQADVKANPGSYGLESGGSYQNGYNAGVTAADNRTNTSSANYKAGYNAGYNAAVSTVGMNKLGAAGNNLVNNGNTAHIWFNAPRAGVYFCVITKWGGDRIAYTTTTGNNLVRADVIGNYDAAGCVVRAQVNAAGTFDIEFNSWNSNAVGSAYY